MNSLADDFFENTQKWQSELKVLRKIVLQTGLNEEIKWKQPCYTFQGTNVVIIGAFKDSCVVSFLKGVLLEDSEKVLVKPGEESQSIRFLRFTNSKQILEKSALITSYLFEAIEIEKAGLKVQLKKEFDFVEELTNKISEDSNFKIAFESLTPGRQRAYNFFFSGSKNAVTRQGRIEKYYNQILNGKGILDCTCGLSKKMPACDGTHKYF